MSPLILKDMRRADTDALGNHIEKKNTQNQSKLIAALQTTYIAKSNIFSAV